jgi:hypothetical protein
MLGVHYFSIYRLIQRGKFKTYRAFRGKLVVPRTELLKLLQTDGVYISGLGHELVLGRF